MRKLIAGIFVCLAVSSASAKEYTIENDHGGLMVKYARYVQAAKIYGTRIRFRGFCASACTLYLSLPPKQLCMEPGSTFGFHAAHSGSTRHNTAATKYLWDSYPYWVQTYLQLRGGLTDKEILMSYSYAKKFIKAC